MELKRSLVMGLILAAAFPVVAMGIGSKPRPGFFGVTQEGGKYWLVTPEGEKFYPMAVNVIKPGDWSPKKDSPMYRGNDIRGGFDKWVSFTADRLRSWGFNTIGSWSHRVMEQQGIPYCATLHIAPWDPHRLIDVWSSKYKEYLRKEAPKQIGDRSPEDPDLIGYFICNELPWYGDFGWPSGGKNLLEKYMELPEDAPGRTIARRYAPDKADEFAGAVAEQFMRVAVPVVRELDPNHMILGCRIAGGAPEPVIEAIGRHSDVFSMNWYVKDGRPDLRNLDRVYLLAKKPVMITEFSYRAMENRGNLKNSRGADVTVPTQAERAKRYTQYVESLGALPQVVGFHWFMYFDQPTLGRFDGEDCNYGIVDHADEPYQELLAAMRDMNARVADLHAASDLALPKTFDEKRPRIGLVVSRAGKPFSGFEYSAGISAEFWGDYDNGFTGSFAMRDGTGHITYDTGSGWGGGVKYLRRDSPMDLSGASRAVVAVKAPEGVKFKFFINEDGVGPHGRESYAGARGADGEQYASPLLTGTGERQVYDLDLVDFERSGGHGNQSGNCQLDMQGVAYVDFYLPGNQGDGVIEISFVKFE